MDKTQEGRPSPAGDDDSLPLLSLRRVTGPGPRHLLWAQTQCLWPAPRKLWALPEKKVSSWGGLKLLLGDSLVVKPPHP